MLLSDIATPPGCKYFFAGDGRSTSETNIGQVSSLAECYKKVTTEHPNANGMTMTNPKLNAAQTTYSCFVENEMVGYSGENNNWVTCFLGDDTDDSNNAANTDDTQTEVEANPGWFSVSPM